MKIVLYLMVLIFVVSSSVSSASLILGSGLSKNYDKYIQILRVSKERSNSISQNLLIIRVLLNIANEYENNSNYFI